ncbi:MAG: hypothetical protein NTZ07_04590 [Candidatus Woesebacteria bacterium]|nr:hypothetical protein [Candidatus Woesebacteria bacterium]
MTERKRGSRGNDYESLKERKFLEGVCWAEWKETLAKSLKDEGLEMPGGEGEKILHEIFVARRLKKIGAINSDQMLERMRAATEGNDDLIDNSRAILFSMQFITNRIGG